MSYTVLPSDPARDRAGILGLWEENFPQAAAGRFAWLYETEAAAGWVLHSGTGDLVGSAGLMRRMVKVPDRLLQAGQPIDLNVAKAHRTIGPAVSLQRAVLGTLQAGHYDLFYAFPNPQSEAVMRRTGYRHLGQLHRWARPLRCGENLRARLPHSRWNRLLARLATRWLSLRSAEAFHRRPSGLRVETTDRFDDRFDALWETASRQFPVIGRRDAAYLAWRFGRCPVAGYRTFCLTDARGALRAYAAYRCRDGFAYLADFLAAAERDLELLLAEFLRAMRREGIEAAVTAFLGPESVVRALRRSGFLRRPAVQNVYLALGPQYSAEPADILREENWYLTQADADTEL